MSHTKGPWIIERNSFGECMGVQSADGSPVLDIGFDCHFYMKPEDEKLFLAAPDLLDALREFHDEVLSYDGSPAPNGYESAERVRALLKRLEGV